MEAKTIAPLFLLAVLVFALIQEGTAPKPESKAQVSSGFERPECYANFFGKPFFDGVPNTRCVCDGEVVVLACHKEPCPVASAVCRGRITGYIYAWGGLTFDSLSSWESQCESFGTGSHTRRDCYEELRRTERVLDSIREDGIR